MKKKNDNIEDLFKEKFQSFEAAPPEQLWATISEEISTNKKRKKGLPFWFTIGGIAASLLLFSVAYFTLANTPNTIEQVVTNQKPEYCPEEENSFLVKRSTNTETTINNQITERQNKKPSISNTKSASTKNSSSNKTLNNPFSKNSIHTINTQNNYASAEITKEKTFTEKKADKIKIDIPTLTELNTKEITDLSEEELASLLTGNEEEVTNNKKLKKWSIQPQIGAFSYNNIGEGSSINTNFSNNPQNTETDLSYSLRIAYQATPKISIRSGIGNTNINITTSDIGVQASSSDNSFSEFFSNDNVSIVNLYEPPTNQVNSGDSFDGLESGDSEAETPENDISSGRISQQIQYIEIPLEITYKVLDKKIGMNLIGGVSTFVLSKNESSFDSNNGSTFLGESSSVNNTSFSSNIGFSINYNLIDNLIFNLEPMAKFQFNSFNKDSEYNPYLIGISSGLQWNF